MKRIPFLFLLVNLAILAFAQDAPQRMRFEHITVADGLPQGTTVIYMIQDHLGFIWMGTVNGLLRYDGTRMTTFQYNPDDSFSFRGKEVSALLEDENGDIWIGAESLFRFERATQRFIEYPDGIKSPNSYMFNFIHEDKQGNIWRIRNGYQGNLYFLERFNPKKNSWIIFNNDPENTHSLEGYLNVYDQIDKDNFVDQGFAEDKNGKIWIITILKDEHILQWFDIQKEKFIPYHPLLNPRMAEDFKKILCVAAGKDGHLYISSLMKGWFVLNTDNGQIRQFKHDAKDAASLLCDFTTKAYQDKSGFVWIPTAMGLDRYDPATNGFSHYISKPGDLSSFSAAWLWHPYEIPGGDIWFMNNTGMSYYNRKTNRLIQYEPDEKKEDSLWGSIYCYFADRRGITWLGSLSNGINKESRINRFPLITNIPGNPNSLQDANVFSIYEAPSEPGVIWIGTVAGLDRYDKKTGNYTHYRHKDHEVNSISKGIVSSITEDKKGRLWVGTSGGGLNLIDRTKRNFIHFVHDTVKVNSLIGNNINILKPDPDGALWVGTNDGLDHFDYDHNKFTHYTIADTSYTPELFNLINQYTTPERQVAAIMHPGNNVNSTDSFRLTEPADFLVTDEGEIDAVENADWGWIEDSSGKIIWDMNFSNTLNDIRTGIIHLNAGSYRLRYKSDEAGSYGHWGGTPPLHPELWGIQVIRITSNEEKIFNNEVVKRYFNGLGDNSILCITEDSKKDIWIGTNNGGVTKFDPASGKFISYKDYYKGPFSVGGSILEDKIAGNLWVGDYLFGLLLINSNGEIIKRYNTSHGLPSNTVRGIQRDSSGILWISTDSGLCRFNPVTEQCQVFNKKNGLQGLDFNHRAFCITADGEMYFGGKNGAIAFYPDQINLDTTVPMVAFTDLDIAGKPATLGKGGQMPVHISEAKEITLAYDQNELIFRFTSLLFNRGNESRFAYKLSGIDKDWVQSGTTRQARYAKLSPGTYTFSVKASNADGVWNERGTSVTIHILPPWWQTGWFRTLAVLASLFLLYGIYRWRTATLHRQKRILEQTVKERTAEVVEEKAEVEKQKEKSDELLLNILPSEVAEELKEKGYTTARSFDEVTILFSDIKGFTNVAERMEAPELVKEIDNYFSAFDRIMQQYGLEKIKTIGDAYIAAGGLPEKNTATAKIVVEAGIAMRNLVEDFKRIRMEKNQPYFELRIGIHTGPVVAGVVGIKKFQYDIWGDTVNMAARMEQSGVPGKINISQYTFDKVKDQFTCTYRGKVEAKNKGEVDMYFVE